MPHYRLTFKVSIVVAGTMDIEARDWEEADNIADNITKNLNEDCPVYYDVARDYKHKASWELNSSDIELYDVKKV